MNKLSARNGTRHDTGEIAGRPANTNTHCAICNEVICAECQVKSSSAYGHWICWQFQFHHEQQPADAIIKCSHFHELCCCALRTTMMPSHCARLMLVLSASHKIKWCWSRVLNVSPPSRHCLHFHFNAHAKVNEANSIILQAILWTFSPVRMCAIQCTPKHLNHKQSRFSTNLRSVWPVRRRWTQQPKCRQIESNVALHWPTTQARLGSFIAHIALDDCLALKPNGILHFSTFYFAQFLPHVIFFLARHKTTFFRLWIMAG